MPIDLQENMTYPAGFGYLGLQTCPSCSSPSHIFVDSERRAERCIRCHQAYVGEYLLLGIPNAEMFPIIAEPLPMCEVCELPELADTTQWKLGKVYLADKSTIVNAHRVCSQVICEKCDTPYASTRHRRYSGQYTIASSLFVFILNIEGEQYCDSCQSEFWETNPRDDYFECECCETHVHYDNSGWWNGTRYCNNCIDSNVYECGDCETLRWEGDDHYCENEDNDNDSDLIHSYSYRPSPFFFGSGKYHFGFELEVESRGNGRFAGAQIAQDSLGGHAYLKEDGSLSDGFEIVTHPHTLDKYQHDFNWGVLDRLKDTGYRSWNTRSCGLHVHVSRTAFGEGDPWAYGISSSKRSQLILQKQAHELRFMKLIYDNQRQVERIAGRSNNQYATFMDKGSLVRKVKHGFQESGRYSAINTENDATIEVRVFKGSLRKERVLSALEFVHASVEYTRDIKVTSKNHALSWLKFTGYVASNAELYPNLVTIMSESFASDDNPNETDN